MSTVTFRLTSIYRLIKIKILMFSCLFSAPQHSTPFPAKCLCEVVWAMVGYNEQLMSKREAWVSKGAHVWALVRYNEQLMSRREAWMSKGGHAWAMVRYYEQMMSKREARVSRRGHVWAMVGYCEQLHDEQEGRTCEPKRRCTSKRWILHVSNLWADLWITTMDHYLIAACLELVYDSDHIW